MCGARVVLEQAGGGLDTVAQILDTAEVDREVGIIGPKRDLSLACAEQAMVDFVELTADQLEEVRTLAGVEQDPLGKGEGYEGIQFE